MGGERALKMFNIWACYAQETSSFHARLPCKNLWPVVYRTGGLVRPDSTEMLYAATAAAAARALGKGLKVKAIRNAPSPMPQEAT
jgi:hypothetical protein